jgi:putative DNA primase/helicase
VDIRSAESAPEAGQALDDESDLLIQPHTDTGNAERLVKLHGHDIRFCSEMKRWLIWDGRRWNLEDTRRIKVLAKRTVRTMYAQAASLHERKREAEKHARGSESAKAISAMLACAEYEEGIPISASELDRDSFLLNFLNGTLNLRSGEIWPHRREDFITKLVHFDYQPNAKCPLFMRFLYRIMGGEPAAPDSPRANRLIAYLQKCFGYALTADVSEKAVFCFFGGGNNGKTTLLEINRLLIAEYSAQVLIENLMAHHGRESSTSLADLADLRGARFVTTSEAEEGQRLAVGKLKYLTQGMGEIKTCRKYENPIRFLTTHKLFIDANHKPIIRGGEKAIWNRLKPIPFTITIPPEEMDKMLLEKLKAEAEGILAWMVEGCQRRLLEGLGDPPEIAEASATWRAESDQFAVFLREKCLLAPDAWVPVAQLWPAYQGWCEANDEKQTLSKSVFDERLKEEGCRQGKREHGDTRAWVGIRFRTPDDDRREKDKRTTRDTKC